MLPPVVGVVLQGVVACVAVHAIRRIASDRISSLVNEFLSCLIVCVMAFENGLIIAEYGHKAWYCSFFLTVLMCVMLTPDGVCASPTAALERAWLGAMSWPRAVVIVAVHCAAAAVAYRYIVLSWSVGLCSLHGKQLVELAACRSLIQVGRASAVLTEGLLTFLCSLAIRAGPSSAVGSRLFIAVLVPLLTVAGSEWTGAFFNPALAQSLTYGCRGLDKSDFFAVYWLGPIVGAIAATRLYPTVDRLMGRRLKTD